MMPATFPPPPPPVSPECAVPAASAAPVNDLAWRVGRASTLVLGVVLLGWALSVDYGKATGAFFGDNSTYYSMTYSLARDFDLEYRREDLERVWREYPMGPEGIFLKRGRDVQGLVLTGSPPFFAITSADDWDRERLYYGKAFIYSVFAAPFVALFGTNGFLVFHALLMTLCFSCAYGFLVARSHPIPAVLFAAVFLFLSVAPVYMVWLTPDFFNLATVMFGYYFWLYKEAVAESTTACLGRWRRRWLMGGPSDVIAAVFLGIATFSKPTLIPLIAPVLLLFVMRRQWRRLLSTGAVFGVALAGLFAWNVAITGEWNYQGGDRRTFYGGNGGFPFQSERTFEAIGEGRATNDVPLEVLATSDAFFHVFRKNLVYFVAGRHHGFAPYFFPGALAVLLFLLSRQHRRAWQWLTLGGAVAAALFLLLYMPFTYSGGGGPVGNRYYLGAYPVFLFLVPPLTGLTSTVVAAAVGAIFTASLVFNPFYVALHAGEHPKGAPYRWLPNELTLLQDLPLNLTPSKARQPIGGSPPVLAYFLDDNVHPRDARENGAFWIRGESRAEMILRAPVVMEQRDGREVARPMQMPRLEVQLESGPIPNRVTIDTGAEKQVVDMPASDKRTVIVRMPSALPYRRDPWVPSNYVYPLSIASARGFVPMFTSGGTDVRFLGVFVRINPLYE